MQIKQIYGIMEVLLSVLIFLWLIIFSWIHFPIGRIREKKVSAFSRTQERNCWKVEDLRFWKDGWEIQGKAKHKKSAM